jgi:hypothetical protein
MSTKVDSAGVRATLSIRLFANEVLVAESDAPDLWQQVFAAITAGKADSRVDALSRAQTKRLDSPPQGKIGESGPVSAMAAEIGVSSDVLIGACSPSNQPPYLHLDAHCWEAIKRNFGTRGPTSVSPTALAATLLAIWNQHRGSEAPLVSDCLAVLRTIHLRDPNTARSLRNCEWLQARGGAVVVNPAQRSRALRIARAYCSKSGAEEERMT